MSEREILVANTEIEKHMAEFTRLAEVAERIVKEMEYHERQAHTWNLFLQHVLEENIQGADVIPLKQELV